MNKHKTIGVLSLLLLFIVIIFFIQIYQVKEELENPKPTVIYDNQNHEIFKEDDKKIKLQQTSHFVQQYVDEKDRYKELPDIIYGDKWLKKWIGHVLVNHFYQEDQIESLYLNQLYFQHGIIGLQNAARYYFNKDLSHLSKLENIFILSQTMISSDDTETNTKNFIADLSKQKLITPREKTEFTIKLPALVNTLYNKNTMAQSYTDYVINELTRRYHVNEKEYFRQGYSVYTSLDTNIQKHAVETIRKSATFSRSKMNNHIESGMAIMDHHSGKIVGLVGGKYYQKNSLNRAFQISRQPASVFKPLIVYSPAIQAGWKPTDLLLDIPMRIGSFTPHNYDFLYRKKVSLEESIIHSYNVPAVWLLKQIGLETGIQFINRYDLFHVDKKEGYSLALGYTQKGTSPLALAQAYSAFPNNGSMVKGYAIEKITDQHNKTVATPKITKKRVMTKKTSIMMKELLQKVIQDGTGENAQIPGQRIGGKTGTTSFDAWFVGFTNKYSAAIWMGPDEVTPANRMDISGGDSPAVLFKKVMEASM